MPRVSVKLDFDHSEIKGEPPYPIKGTYIKGQKYQVTFWGAGSFADKIEVLDMTGAPQTEDKKYFKVVDFLDW